MMLSAGREIFNSIQDFRDKQVKLEKKASISVPPPFVSIRLLFPAISPLLLPPLLSQLMAFV